MSLLASQKERLAAGGETSAVRLAGLAALDNVATEARNVSNPRGENRSTYAIADSNCASTREGDRDGGVFLRRGVVILPMNPSARMRLKIHQECPSWFRVRIGGVPIVEIWMYECGRLVLCYNEASKGFPRRFEEGEQRDLVTP